MGARYWRVEQVDMFCRVGEHITSFQQPWDENGWVPCVIVLARHHSRPSHDPLLHLSKALMLLKI